MTTPYIAPAGPRTLTMSQWYAEHRDTINDFVRELITKLDAACQAQEQNHVTMGVSISVDRKILRSSMIAYMYEHSYSRFKSWV